MSATFRSARQAGLTSGNALLTGVVTAHLCTAAYTPVYDTHATTASLTGVVKTTTLTGKSITGDSFTSNAALFTAVSGGSPAIQVVLSCDGNLIGVIDDFGAGPRGTSIPLNGSDIEIQPHANGWLRARNA